MSSPSEPKLPQDVVEEILKRLPVRSLLRCRCFSRSWRSTIDDPRFVALHLNHSTLDASNWFLACMEESDLDQWMCSLLPSDSLTLSSQSRIEIPFVTPSDFCYIEGSCNGLICVEVMSIDGRAPSTYLWNLFTRKHKAVRRFSMESIDGVKIATGDVALAFGFDARSNDYKIVRTLDNADGIKRAEIYSLGADSWRSLECDVPAFCLYEPSVFVNGNLHWPGDNLREEDGCGSIILFDLTSEVFDEMALPEGILPIVRADSRVSLSVLNDSLAVCIGEVVGHPQRYSICSVWVMREYRVHESWTQLYSFEAWGEVSKFNCFTGNGELLMVIDDDDPVSWNPVTRQFAILPRPVGFGLTNVVESLVSP